MYTQQSLISDCPSCHQSLTITQLTCKNCGLVLTHDFTFNHLSRLKEEQIAFIEMFLKCSGNLKEMQNLLHLSYPAVKKRLANIQEELGLMEVQKTPVSTLEPVIQELPVYQDESRIVNLIKKKLNAAGGLVSIPLPKGSSFLMIYEEYGNGVCAGNLPKNRVITWKALDCAMHLLEERKQAAKKDPKISPSVMKGNAMKGKLGDNDLPLDSLEGYVAYHAYGIQPGESCQRTITALAAILEWSGLCKNGYGYVELLE